MSRPLQRLAVAGSIAAVLLGVTVALPTTAQAASLGSLKITPATGNVIDSIKLLAPANCPATATNIDATITGGGLGANKVLLLGNNPLSLFGPDDLSVGGITTSDTLFGTLQSNAVADAAFPGTYTFQLICNAGNAFTTANNRGTFDGQLTITGAGAAATYALVVPVGAASTTTLTANPASPVLAGTNVTLTAQVASTAAVAGTVTFKDGATVLNAAPAVVDATGKATFATAALTAGTKSITATFTPTDASVVAGSTSAALAYTVNGPAVATTTSLTAPATATTADAIPLNAQVTPAAAGQITFKEGATTVGGPIAVDATGKASLSLTGVTAATHNYTATFTPTDAAAFVASASGNATVVVSAFAGFNLNNIAGGGENITATVGAGTLTLTAATTAVDLGTLALSPDNAFLTNNTGALSAGTEINPVTVTDTRSGSLGYTVSGIAGDFVAGNNTDKINSENLGWAPHTVGVVPAGITIAAGAPVAPAAHIAVGAVSAPVAGLKASRVLAAAAAGASVGTVQVGAALTLQAPTTTKAGTYSTTLVITAI